MSIKEVRYLFRKKETSGSTLPVDGMVSEPFVNTFEGRMFFYGTPGGTYNLATGQPNVFEVGGNVGYSNILSAINLNNLFIVTGSTGQITTYGGVSNLSGYFLSGTPYGFVLAPISDIQSSGGTGMSTFVQPGLNTYTGGTASNPTVNISAATLSFLNVSGATSLEVISATTIMSGGTNLYDIFSPISFTGSTETLTYVQPGLNTYTGGTASNPTVNVSAATLSYLSATTVSATTLQSLNYTSGGTSLETIVLNIISANTQYPLFLWNM